MDQTRSTQDTRRDHPARPGAHGVWRILRVSSASAQVAAATIVACAWPVTALGAGVETEWGRTEATAIVGVVAAFAWRHVARRANLARRWQQMNIGDRLPVLRIGERLQHLHLRETLAAALGLRHDPHAAAGAQAHRRRVLIVDDDPDIRSVLAEGLAAEGFAVSEAADGYEGLRRAREERPDVILLDLMMPRMDGFEFRAAQREDARISAVPVVVISGVESPQVQNFGAAAYLHKPFDLRVLLDAVDRHALAA